MVGDRVDPVRALLTRGDLAFVLQFTEQQLTRQLPRLCQLHGFPRAVPGLRPPRWDPQAIDEWLGGIRHPAPAQQLELRIGPVAANDGDRDPLAAELAARGKRVAKAR